MSDLILNGLITTLEMESMLDPHDCRLTNTHIYRYHRGCIHTDLAVTFEIENIDRLFRTFRCMFRSGVWSKALKMSKDDRESALTAIYATLPESARRRANSRSQEYRLMKQDTDGRISRSADAPVALSTQKGYATLKKTSSPIPSSIN